MIRVTLEDGSVIENIIAYQKESVDLFVCINGLDNVEVYSLDKVFKIEKQIKDLTSDEIYKVFSAAYGNDLNYIEVCEDSIIVNIFDYGEKTYIEYFYDDYIDVTDMIKRA